MLLALGSAYIASKALRETHNPPTHLTAVGAQLEDVQNTAIRAETDARYATSKVNSNPNAPTCDFAQHWEDQLYGTRGVLDKGTDGYVMADTLMRLIANLCPGTEYKAAGA